MTSAGDDPDEGSARPFEEQVSSASHYRDVSRYSRLHNTAVLFPPRLPLEIMPSLVPGIGQSGSYNIGLRRGTYAERR